MPRTNHYRKHATNFRHMWLSTFLQQGRFQQMSEAIIGRIDEMGSRIDELEASIGELMAQAGVEEDEDGKKDGEDGDKNEAES